MSARTPGPLRCVAVETRHDKVDGAEFLTLVVGSNEPFAGNLWEHGYKIVEACNAHDGLVTTVATMREAINERVRERDALAEALQDAYDRLQGFINSDCECDNTHATNETTCCLCWYRAALAKVKR